MVATDAVIDTARGTLNLTDDPRMQAIIKGRVHRPALYLMIQNASAGKWDTAGITAMLADPRRARALVDRSVATIKAIGWQGAVFDIEQISGRSLGDYQALLGYAHARFAAAGLKLAVTAPGDDPAWDLIRFAAADFC